MVGCPLRNRNWIMPYWLDRVKVAAKKAKVDLSFAFVVEKNEIATLEWLWENIDTTLYIKTTGETGRDANHSWTEKDFPRMAGLRNVLLGQVRQVEPDHFLSLDSDLLLEPEALVEMYEALQWFDAVGVKTSMCRHIWCESWMYYAPSADVFVRINEARPQGSQSVDAIMAGKLMTPQAYKINYRHDKQGEDLGWCRNTKEAGLRLGIAGCARHVMHEDDLNGTINFSQ